ncbi:type II secretion system protein GspN [uncultured Desulfobulbus sp.]|uniref:type II secretion system protein GspN n=1 Tax=uncultured Desulfobulbus sp. TaxID=239745 RepID=UPI0029C672FC|nr:type II secretion system protein GspN [uncultured Desulfobulbus sp.]
MLRKALGWVGRSVGYLLYALGLIGLLLWLLFPQEAVRRYLEASLNRVSPTLRWQIEGVALEIPEGLTLRAIGGYEKGEGKIPLLRINSLTLRPNIAESLQAGRPQVGYWLTAGKGTVAGIVRMTDWQKVLQVEGTVQDSQLTDFPLLSRQLGRTLQGSISGTFTGTILLAKGEMAELEARLKVANGRLGLKRPILGHTELPFSQGTFTLRGHGDKLELAQGRVESELFGGQFSGTITMHRDLALSQLDLKGTMQPKTKFFKGLDNTVALQAFRVQLKDNSLPFRVSGDLSNPGIHFEEYSMHVQTLEKELK